MASNREVLGFTHDRPQNYSSSNLPTRSPTTHFLQTYADEHPFPFLEGIPFPYAHISTSTHVNRRQTQTNPTRGQMPAQMVPEQFHSANSPSAMREAPRDDVISASHPPYNPGPYGTSWNGHVVSNPSWPLFPQPSGGCLLPPHVSEDIRGPGNQLLGGPSAHQFSSHGTYSHYTLASAVNSLEVAGPPHLAHQSSIHSGPNWRSHPTSSWPFETSLNYRFVPPQESSRRRQRARAILYGGLWLDEEELLESRKGELMNVHRCLWEEDRVPCNLWVKSDKSSIRAHIQKWHRGKPGGDKLEVECRWSGCGRKMLKESVARHILGVHLKEMWICQNCEKKVTRKDAFLRHAAESDFEGCRTAGPLVTYSADEREIDARAALESGGRLRYADA